MLEPRIHLVLDKASNSELEDIPNLDEIVEKAGEDFKAALRRQFTRQQEDFRLRMSNVGKPTCQLQMAAQGVTPKRKPYSFVIQMLIGDAVECITDAVLQIAGINITGSKNQVELDINGTVIQGEDDIEIDNKVYDIKSSAPWTFDNKWMKGYDGLKEDDAFGYIGQLTGYADAQGKKAGGWIVVNKSDGRLIVVEADTTQEEHDAALDRMRNNVKAITQGDKFERCFTPVEDRWRGKATGLKVLPKTCEFCDYIGTCWPNAEFKSHPNSKPDAKSPRRYWFVEEE